MRPAGSANVLACLAGAGLGVSSLVKVTTFLLKREYADANSAIITRR
ncbi:hypothetical protein ACFPOI_34085 [Nonomuraea angiospora]|uniref:Enamine deaminase RidA (YjgF/YER057c/UK114 family) n=1 Tax=Nonomuraea angiospora TaxID=46172 RepID=A0ABR9LUD7_9ACTN|nr:hypothetical protein [Nonomuraea angiospora]MBE1583873.1 enamine deaminase RidA (YjgF/YER057c/UK114 family) [Nonomuraea angiospora]